MFDLQNPLVFKPELETYAGVKAAFSAIRRTCGGYVNVSPKEESRIKADIHIGERLSIHWDSASPDSKRGRAMLTIKRNPNPPFIPMRNSVWWMNLDFHDIEKSWYGVNDYFREGLVCAFGDYRFRIDLDTGGGLHLNQKQMVLLSFVLEAFTHQPSNIIYHAMIAERERGYKSRIDAIRESRGYLTADTIPSAPNEVQTAEIRFIKENLALVYYRFEYEYHHPVVVYTQSKNYQVGDHVNIGIVHDSEYRRGYILGRCREA